MKSGFWNSYPLHAKDPVAECEAFFARFQKCVDEIAGTHGMSAKPR